MRTRPARRLSIATARERERDTNASTPGSDASSPGQCAPAPSAAQKIPNVVSITPTANFSVFSGTRSSGARTSDADDGDEHERDAGAERGEPDAALRAAEREDDERDLEPLEQHALEREREAVPVEARALLVPCGARLRQLAREDRRLVVQRLVAARAQDRLAQPLQPEHEQQRRRRRGAARRSG